MIKGKAFVLGKNIDTDQIIPAAHLVYSLEDPEERKFYGRYALSGVPEEQSGLPNGGIPLVKPDEFESEFTIVVGGPNFGCGSSREHAPAALQIAGIKAIVSPGYAGFSIATLLTVALSFLLKALKILVLKLKLVTNWKLIRRNWNYAI
jgi:3-isopropylmalate/(R)-2-methylmalate dehydratase small subunit